MSSSSSKPVRRGSKARVDEYVREWEADEKVSLAVAKRHARLFPASKVAGAWSRRDHDEDAAIFQAVAASVRHGNAVCFGRGRRPPVYKGYPSFPELADEGRDEKGRSKHTIWTPDWSHTGDRLKMLSFARVLISGNAAAFTSHLHPAVVERGLASPRGFVGYLSDRLVRELGKAGLDIHAWAFSIEASPLHEPHLHGVLGAAPGKTIRGVLRRMGGHHGTPTGREVHVEQIWGLEGWVQYVTKAPLVTRKTINSASVVLRGSQYRGGILGASRAVRADAARWYRDKRATSVPIN